MHAKHLLNEAGTTTAPKPRPKRTAPHEKEFDATVLAALLSYIRGEIGLFNANAVCLMVHKVADHHHVRLFPAIRNGNVHAEYLGPVNAEFEKHVQALTWAVDVMPAIFRTKGDKQLMTIHVINRPLGHWRYDYHLKVRLNRKWAAPRQSRSTTSTAVQTSTDATKPAAGTSTPEAAA